MAKSQNQALATKAPVGDLAMPSYAGKIEGHKSTAAENNRPKPRIKIVQGSSKPELKREYKEGAALLSPENTLLASAGEPFIAIPLFLFETWELHSDINDKGAPVVRESTTDPRTPLAQKCMLNDADMRIVKYGANFTAKYHHVLNAVLLIDDGENKGAYAVSSWKVKGGGSRTGKNFAGIVARREEKGVWCYMNRLAFKTVEVEANDYAWWTLEASNPDADPFVAENRIAELKAMHEQLGKLHSTVGIAVTAEDAEASGKTADDDDLPV